MRITSRRRSTLLSEVADDDPSIQFKCKINTINCCWPVMILLLKIIAMLSQAR